MVSGAPTPPSGHTVPGFEVTFCLPTGLVCMVKFELVVDAALLFSGADGLASDGLAVPVMVTVQSSVVLEKAVQDVLNTVAPRVEVW